MVHKINDLTAHGYSEAMRGSFNAEADQAPAACPPPSALAPLSRLAPSQPATVLHPAPPRCRHSSVRGHSDPRASAARAPTQGFHSDTGRFGQLDYMRIKMMCYLVPTTEARVGLHPIDCRLSRRSVSRPLYTRFTIIFGGCFF